MNHETHTHHTGFGAGGWREGRETERERGRRDGVRAVYFGNRVWWKAYFRCFELKKKRVAARDLAGLQISRCWCACKFTCDCMCVQEEVKGHSFLFYGHSVTCDPPSPRGCVSPNKPSLTFWRAQSYSCRNTSWFRALIKPNPVQNPGVNIKQIYVW